MQKLLNGALTFRRHMFSAYRGLFEELSKGQSPEALFITCSDSRVVPTLITAADPGDLFVLRNIGNIIPPYDPEDRDNAEAAALEYALSILKVKHIVVCGHSRCGAMKAAMGPLDPRVRQVRSWLRHVDPAKRIHSGHPQVVTQQPDSAEAMEQERVDLLSQLNVLVQIKHIKTYPSALERLNSGALELHAWFFEIDHASLYTYNNELDEFISIEQALHPAAEPTLNLPLTDLPLLRPRNGGPTDRGRFAGLGLGGSSGRS